MNEIIERKIYNILQNVFLLCPTVVSFTNFRWSNHVFKRIWGAPGWLGRLSVRLQDFGSGHDLTAREFEPRVGLCRGSPIPGHIT